MLSEPEVNRLLNDPGNDLTGVKVLDYGKVNIAYSQNGNSVQ